MWAGLGYHVRSCQRFEVSPLCSDAVHGRIGHLPFLLGVVARPVPLPPVAKMNWLEVRSDTLSGPGRRTPARRAKRLAAMI